jgi:Gpi18-like mannosyltransferase
MWKLILKLFILLQIVLIGGWHVGSRFLPLRTETFLGRGLGGKVVNQPLLWSRANYDGFYYAKIARDGYQHLQQAFFPFYSKLISLFQRLFGGYVLSGIIISSVSFLIFLFLLTELMRQSGEEESVIRKTIIYYAFFPTAFYFVSVYTESIFMLLVIASFYLAAKKKWLLAGLTAGLASYTRVIGVFLVPALIYEYYEIEAKRDMKSRFDAAKNALQKRFSWAYLKYLVKTRLPHIKNIGSILTGVWGFVVYGLYLHKTKDNFFYFIEAQSGFTAGRQVNKVVLIYQVLWRYLKMIFTVDIASYTYLIVWYELLITLVFIFLLLYAWLGTKISRSWIIFSAFAFVLPTLTGTFTSMPRYVLACFPCFITLAKLKLPRYIYWFSFAILVLSSMLFVRGYWIA